MKKRNILTKIIIFLFASMFLFTCSEQEVIFEYPDCIPEPAKTVISYGCGNIFVYQFLDSLTAVTVSIDASKFELTEQCQSYNLGNNPDGISVRMEVAGGDPDSIYFNYCNDVGYLNQGTTTTYNAVSGEITFSVSKDNPVVDPIWQTNNYNVTVKITGLHLYNQEYENEIIINEIIFWNVRVGWFVG